MTLQSQKLNSSDFCSFVIIERIKNANRNNISLMKHQTHLFSVHRLVKSNMNKIATESLQATGILSWDFKSPAPKIKTYLCKLTQKLNRK